jgi:hypothetical protein
MNPVPVAWLVKHKWNNVDNKYVTLERSKADDYAAQWHGTIYPLYEIVLIQDGKEKLMIVKEEKNDQQV